MVNVNDNAESKGSRKISRKGNNPISENPPDLRVDEMTSSNSDHLILGSLVGIRLQQFCSFDGPCSGAATALRSGSVVARIGIHVLYNPC